VGANGVRFLVVECIIRWRSLSVRVREAFACAKASAVPNGRLTPTNERESELRAFLPQSMILPQMLIPIFRE
jgi:hypothetical protein